jgi:hypothetical protein
MKHGKRNRLLREVERAPRNVRSRLMRLFRGRSVLLWLSLAAVLATGTTVALFIFERSHQWAHDWLPNLAVELVGIFVAVGIFDALRERQRENELKPLRARSYGLVLRDLDLIGLNSTSYLERFVDPSRQPMPQNPIEAVRAIDAAYVANEVPTHVRGSWVDGLKQAAKRLDETCEIYQPFWPPRVVDPLYALVAQLEATARGIGVVIGSTETFGNYKPLGPAYEAAYRVIKTESAKLSRPSQQPTRR